MWNVFCAPLVPKTFFQQPNRGRARLDACANLPRAQRRAQSASHMVFARRGAPHHLFPRKLEARIIWPLSVQRIHDCPCRPLASVRLAGTPRSPTRRRRDGARALHQHSLPKACARDLAMRLHPICAWKSSPLRALARCSVYAIGHTHTIAPTHAKPRRPLRPRRWVIALCN